MFRTPRYKEIDNEVGKEELLKQIFQLELQYLNYDTMTDLGLLIWNDWDSLVRSQSFIKTEQVFGQTVTITNFLVDGIHKMFTGLSIIVAGHVYTCINLGRATIRTFDGIPVDCYGCLLDLLPTNIVIG